MTTNLSKYKKLSDIDHVLIRPGMWVGSLKLHTAETFNPSESLSEMIHENTTWNPGFVKLFDEIISNSVDESKRNPKLTKINVTLDETLSKIIVEDNGGIPVKLHQEYGEYIPTIIFGYLRSGSNFDDTEDSELAGQNGLGSTLVNIFSTSFTVETSDGESLFKQEWTSNMKSVGNPIIHPKSVPGFTRITYVPDWKALDIEPIIGNYKKIIKRIVDVAGCNPHLQICLNGVQIKFKSFKNYIELYTTEFEYDETKDWTVGVSKSHSGNFCQVSFVNTTEVSKGGTHVDYVAWQIVEEVRSFLLKKHKIEVKPADVRNHLSIFIKCNIVRPRYDGQTKENLITEVRDYKTSWVPSQQFIKDLMKSSVIDDIISWVEAKALQRDLEEQRRKNKTLTKANPKRIEKLDDAGLAGKEPLKTMLFIMEGDSAKGPILSGRNPKTMGAYALRGKPQNANSVKLRKLLGMDKTKDEDDTEFSNLMVSIGLQIGVKVESLEQLRYSKIVILVDSDEDGSHIYGLLVSNLHKFWPELFELGAIYRFYTPLLKVWQKNKKDPIPFDNVVSYETWLTNQSNASSVKQIKYYKGLATSSTQEFKYYLDNYENYLCQIRIDNQKDSDIINLVFGKEGGAADKRKHWMALSDEYMDGEQE